MSDDDVIDLRNYLFEDADNPLQYFSVWGGDGEHSRFSLPLWRAIYIAVGERAGLVWAPRTGEQPPQLEPHFVLDLASENARTDFPMSLVEGLTDERAPALFDQEAEGLAVLLGEQGDRRWYLVVDSVSDTRGPLDRQGREDLLFLAGEAAGLLFHRGLTTPAEPVRIDTEPNRNHGDLDVVRDLEHLGLRALSDDPEDDLPEFDGYDGDDDSPGPQLV